MTLNQYRVLDSIHKDRERSRDHRATSHVLPIVRRLESIGNPQNQGFIPPSANNLQTDGQLHSTASTRAFFDGQQPAGQCQSRVTSLVELASVACQSDLSTDLLEWRAIRSGVRCR